MAAPTKPPRALLSETNDPEKTILIFRKIKYENLVKTAYTAFSHTYSRDDHNVHFHVASEDFRGGRCRAALFPDLWEEYEYLTGEITDDGELRVWAHFIRKPQEQEALIQETASVAESEDPIQADFRPDRNVERLLASFRKPRRSNRARDSVAPYRRIESRRESTATIDEEDGPVYHKAIPRYNPDVHPALPEDATPDNHARDLQAEKNNNSQDEFKTTSTPISQLNKEYQRTIALARLMYGSYGITALVPCDHCVKKNKPCRLFHPLLYSKGWYQVNKHWQIKENGRRACACCMVYSAVRGMCNAQYTQYTQYD